MKTPFFRHLSAIALCLCTTTTFARKPRPANVSPRQTGGGFDLTWQLIQVSLMETGAIENRCALPICPAALAVAYNAIVAQRPAEAGTVVAFSGGSPLLNLSGGNSAATALMTCAGWPASVPTTA